MRGQEKYRFYLLNGCYGTSITVTGVTMGVDGGGNFVAVAYTGGGLAVDDYVSLSGFHDLIDGIHQIAAIVTILGVTTFKFYVGPESLPGLTTGTVLKIAKRYVKPLNFAKCKAVWEKKDEQVFFEEKINGKLLFDKRNGDWQYFIDNIQPNQCCEVKFVIEKLCSGAWVNRYEGVFSASDCDWDESKCTVEVAIQPDNAYSCLDSNKSDKINFLPEVATQSVFITNDVTYEEVECCSDGDIEVQGFALPDGETSCVEVPFVTIPITQFWDSIMFPCSDDTAQCCSTIKKVEIRNALRGTGLPEYSLTGQVCITYLRETKITLDNGGAANPPAQGDGAAWCELETLTVSGYPARKWVRKPKLCPVACVTSSSTGTEMAARMEALYGGFAQSWIGDCLDGTGTFVMETPNCLEEATTTEYTRGRTLGDIATYIATKTCASVVGVRSDFFEINPPGDTTGYVAGTNYVTGADNVIANILLVQKSDFLNPDADEPATIGELSFTDLMDLLRIAFNAYWFIDADGYLRIEHISWFNRTAAIDTTQTARFNRKITEGLKRYTFDKNKTPIREEFSWMEVADVDFKGKPITYSSLCANKDKVNNFDLANITTDVDFIQDSPDSISPDGFVMLALDPDDITQIHRENGQLTGIEKNNAHLAWANLHQHYHRHNRPVIAGNMNGTQQTFESAMKSRRQTTIKYVPECCELPDPLTDLVTTDLGNGLIDKMEQSFLDGTISLELLYDA